MSLFIDSPAQADAPGAYAVEVPTPSNIDEVSLGYIGFVGQFDWGPMQSVFIPQDAKQLVDTFQPAGSPRTSTGWRAVMKRRGFTAKIVRVLDEDAIKATLSDAGTGGNLVSTAKYFGTLGNSIVRTIAAASGGDTAKRDLTYTLTDPVTGTTSETYKDVAMNSAPDVSKSLLLGSIVFSGGTMTVWPGNGSLNLAAGTNGGSLASIDYTGTAGAADAGVALFETQADVRVLVHDDCGNTMRAAVNAAFEAQCETLRDRIAVLESDPDAASWAAVKAAVTGSLVDGRVIWCGAWVTAADDSGIDRTTPFSSFIATALVNLEPQQSHSWRDPRVLKYFDGITGIVAAFSTASKVIQGEATKTAFICLPILTAKGKYAALHDRTTAGTFATTRRIEDFLALSALPAMEPYINGPNVVEENTQIKSVFDVFISEQVRKGRLVDAVTDINSVNNATTMGAGEFYLKLTARSPAPREKIFLLFQVGTTITVQKAA